MKCAIIRDLLPLYEIGQCSKKTRDIVKEHLGTCSECSMLYNEMHEGINFNEFIEQSEESTSREFDITNNKDNEFWRKYYGRLFVKGLIIFMSICILTNIIGVVFFMKR